MTLILLYSERSKQAISKSYVAKSVVLRLLMLIMITMTSL